VSQLRKCVKVPTEIIDPLAIEIESDLTYTEHPIRVLDTKERSTRRETIKMFKIHWDHHTVTVRVLVMLDIYFVSVKYVLVSVKLMCVYVKLLKI
jgi:hypothetical protein